MKTINTITFLVLVLATHYSFAQCWKEIAAGSGHTLAIKVDGTLWAWGRNHLGQLGDGTTVNKNVPNQIGTDTDWAIIDAKEYNSIALKTNGTLWTWGDNIFGQIGNGNFGNGEISNAPTQIGNETDWIKISTGGLRTFAIKANGTLWGCGYNEYGHLGIGNTSQQSTFIQIGKDNDWLDISAGLNQTLAIKTNNTLWGWGLNKAGSLAIGIPDTGPIIMIPTQTGNNTLDWQYVTIGGCCSSKMIKTDGSLWAMGTANSGNLGIGEIDFNSVYNMPTRIGIENNWKTISNTNHTCALKNNSTLWAWGSNPVGQVGDGTFVNKSFPIQIGSDNLWQKIITGAIHTIGLTVEGDLYAWGYNNYGQLGDGTFQTRNVPTLIGNSCSLSTNGFKILQLFKAYPNPTNNATILSYNLAAKSTITFTITNTLGQIVYKKNKTSVLGENQESIDLSSFSSGVYYISLQTTTEQNTIKVIKN